MAKRWNHKVVARTHDVPEDVVRRIYSAVQLAKGQGLYGGYAADLLDRSIGRRVAGHELGVYRKAKEHLGYDPPSGYGGPKPSGAAKEPPRPSWSYNDPKAVSADRMVSCADRRIDEVIKRSRSWDADPTKDRTILQHAADDLAVAADAYEELGARIKAGTLRERASYARRGNHNMLAAYRSHSAKSGTKRVPRAPGQRPKRTSRAAKLDREIAAFLGRTTR